MAKKELGVIFKSNAKQHAKEVDETAQSYKNLGNAILGALKLTSPLAAIKGLKNYVDAMNEASKAEAEYIESMNLLKVSYEDNITSANELINKLKDMYGLDPAGLTQQLGVYKQMTSAMGMANETSALLSENLLKMQEDVASLYNLDFDEVGKKFQSALAGQSRALYSLGVDITKTSLQQELYNMGIDKNVNELNKASKTALTYIVMQKQLSNSYGDASNTINSLANQTKIWQEQTSIAARQIKALVIPVLSTIITYANGIIMAFNGVMETILKFLGVDVEQMASQYGIGSVEIEDGINGIGEAAIGAGKEIEKLQTGLRGFDKLNVITTPKDSSSSGGAGASGGIDAGIAKYLKEYNLKDASNNATIIRDRIIEWLDMLKPIEESLGRIAGLTWDGLQWLWENILKPMGKWAKETFLPTLIDTIASALDAVYNVAKTMKPVLKWIMENVVIPFGKTLGKTIINLLKNIKGAFDLISKSKVLQYIIGSAGLVVGFTKLLKIGKNVYSLFGKTKLGSVFYTFNGTLVDSFKSTTNLKEGFKSFYDLIVNEGDKTAKSIMGLKINTDALQSTVSGAIQTALGISMIQTAIQDIEDENFNLMDAILLTVGSIETVMGSIELFTGVIGGLNTLITGSNPFALLVTSIVAVGGLIWALEASLDTTGDFIEEMEDARKKSEDFNKTIEEGRKQIEKRYEADLIGVQTAQNYVEELKNITDENGKIKEGYETRARFIVGQLNEAYGTELKIVNGILQNRKEELDTIDKIIQKKQAEIFLNIKQDEYKQALIDESKILKQLDIDYDNVKKAEEKVQEEKDRLSTSEEEYQNLVHSGLYTAGEIMRMDEMRYGTLWELEKKEDDMKKAYENTEKSYKDTRNSIMQYTQMYVAYEDNKIDELNDVYYNGAKNREETTKNDLIEQTRIIKDLGKHEVLAAWKLFARDNEQAYYDGLSKLTVGQKTIIHNAVYGLDNDYGKELINEFKKTGEKSESELLKELEKLPQELQTNVINGMIDNGYQISAKLQEGISKINPSITIITDTSGVQRAVNTLFKTIENRRLKITTSDSGEVRIDEYAQGGFVDEGQLFVAREAGAEMVGTINGKTAVANNDQIVDAISIGVARAMTDRNTNVTIKADADTQGLLNFINFKQQQKNRQYGL